VPIIQNTELRRALTERIRYYNELGIYDFYRREPPEPIAASPSEAEQALFVSHTELREAMSPRKAAVVAKNVEENIVPVLTPRPEQAASDPIAALKVIREDLGDCTRCKLHKQGRKQIVFGVGNPRAELMFVGEGPGADEDARGEPFVGRAGQLLNNMIKAMGLRREDVYICNVVKCRPPENRPPEPDEVEVCSQYLLRQIDAINPKVLVCLGAVAAKTLLETNRGITQFRGQWLEWRGRKLMATYHPAYLLRNPNAKGEVWKDLQKVMAELGLQAPKKKPS